MRLFILAVLFPATAFAIPLPKGPRASVVLPPTFTADYAFEGIIALSNCSGSLIQFEGATDNELAVVLTNGHCLEPDMPEPGEVIDHRPTNRTFQIFDNRANKVGRLRASMVLYSSMTKSDITLYRLTETYAQIRSKYNVRPFALSSQHPTTGTGIEVISGYWRRGYTCQIEAFVHELNEGGYKMFDSIRYSRPGCEVIGGTSGSPVIQAGTRTVIGINNTGNEDGQRCTMNNPCEIDETGKVTYTKGFTYGQQTYQIYSCLTPAHDIDLSMPGCKL